MTPERLAVLTRVADGLPDLERPVLVVVDGGDGAGRPGRFADDLAPRPRESPASLWWCWCLWTTSTIPRSFRSTRLGRTGDTVWSRSSDHRALRHHLLDLWCPRCGAAYRRRHHDLATDSPLVDEGLEPVPERGVLVVDGVFAQRAEAGPAAGTWSSGSTCRTRNGYAGWPSRDGVAPDLRRPPGEVPGGASPLPRRR